MTIAEGEDQIDEGDPLWQATLKLTLGDREKALKMLEDPDALMQYPEIREIMEGGQAAADDWEKDVDALSTPSAAAKLESEAIESAPMSPTEKKSPTKAKGSEAAAEWRFHQ